MAQATTPALPTIPTADGNPVVIPAAEEKTFNSSRLEEMVVKRQENGKLGLGVKLVAYNSETGETSPREQDAHQFGDGDLDALSKEYPVIGKAMYAVATAIALLSPLKAAQQAIANVDANAEQMQKAVETATTNLANLQRQQKARASLTAGPLRDQFIKLDASRVDQATQELKSWQDALAGFETTKADLQTKLDDLEAPLKKS